MWKGRLSLRYSNRGQLSVMQFVRQFLNNQAKLADAPRLIGLERCHLAIQHLKQHHYTAFKAAQICGESGAPVIPVVMGVGNLDILRDYFKTRKNIRRVVPSQKPIAPVHNVTKRQKKLQDKNTRHLNTERRYTNFKKGIYRLNTPKRFQQVREYEHPRNLDHQSLYYKLKTMKEFWYPKPTLYRRKYGKDESRTSLKWVFIRHKRHRTSDISTITP